MGLQQPAGAATSVDSVRLDLPDGDALAPAGRLGCAHVSPQDRDARKRSSTLAGDAGGAYDDGTRRTEILQTAATLIASSGFSRTTPGRSPTAAASAGKLQSPSPIEGSDPGRAGPAVLHRSGPHRRNRPRPTGRARLAARVRQDRRVGIGDRALRGSAPRRSADVVLRRADRQPRARRVAQAHPPTAVQEAMLELFVPGFAEAAASIPISTFRRWRTGSASR